MPIQLKLSNPLLYYNLYICTVWTTEYVLVETPHGVPPFWEFPPFITPLVQTHFWFFSQWTRKNFCVLHSKCNICFWQGLFHTLLVFEWIRILIMTKCSAYMKPLWHDDSVICLSHVRPRFNSLLKREIFSFFLRNKHFSKPFSPFFLNGQNICLTRYIQ